MCRLEFHRYSGWLTKPIDIAGYRLYSLQQRVHLRLMAHIADSITHLVGGTPLVREEGILHESCESGVKPGSAEPN